MPRKVVDLTDRIFGQLIVVDREMDPKKRIQSAATWYCMCDCGEFKYATTQQLTSGRVKSCGCTLKKPKRPMFDLTGERFGILTALKRVESQGGKSAWACKCDCGKYRIVKTGLLRAGRVKSCGYCTGQAGRKPKYVYDSIEQI